MKKLVSFLLAIFLLVLLIFKLWGLSQIVPLSELAYPHPDILHPVHPLDFIHYISAVTFIGGAILFAQRLTASWTLALGAGVLFLLNPLSSPALLEPSQNLWALSALLLLGTFSGRFSLFITIPLSVLFLGLIATQDISIAWAAIFIPCILARCSFAKWSRAIMEAGILVLAAILLSILHSSQPTTSLALDAPYWMRIVTAPEMAFHNITAWLRASPESIYMVLWNPIDHLTISLIYWVGLLVMYRICGRLKKYTALPLLAVCWVFVVGIVPLFIMTPNATPLRAGLAVLLSVPLLALVTFAAREGLSLLRPGNTGITLARGTLGIALLVITTSWFAINNFAPPSTPSTYAQRIAQAREQQGDTLPLLVEEARLLTQSGKHSQANQLFGILIAPEIYPDAALPYTEKDFVIAWFQYQTGDSKNSADALNRLATQRPYDTRIEHLLMEIKDSITQDQLPESQ